MEISDGKQGSVYGPLILRTYLLLVVFQARSFARAAHSAWNYKSWKSALRAWHMKLTFLIFSCISRMSIDASTRIGGFVRGASVYKKKIKPGFIHEKKSEDRQVRHLTRTCTCLGLFLRPVPVLD